MNESWSLQIKDPNFEKLDEYIFSLVNMMVCDARAASASSSPPSFINISNKCLLLIQKINPPYGSSGMSHRIETPRQQTNSNEF